MGGLLCGILDLQQPVELFETWAHQGAMRSTKMAVAPTTPQALGAWVAILLLRLLHINAHRHVSGSPCQS